MFDLLPNPPNLPPLISIVNSFLFVCLAYVLVSQILPNGTAWIPSIVETITKVALTETKGIVVDQKLIDGPDPNDKWKLFIPLILAFQVCFSACCSSLNATCLRHKIANILIFLIPDSI